MIILHENGTPSVSDHTQRLDGAVRNKLCRSSILNRKQTIYQDCTVMNTATERCIQWSGVLVSI